MQRSIWSIWTLIAIMCLTVDLSAQSDTAERLVTLTVSGQGVTQDAARQSALRNAIEQAFGTFISSKTEILNDQLIKDEIVSVSNGNIQAFDILSELEIPGGAFSSTLKATVSVSRLTSFVESKGVAVEFKGALFAMNIKQQLLNEESEVKAIADLADVVKQISDKSFDFFIAAKEPTAKGQHWDIPLTVTVKPNSNLALIPAQLSKVLAGLTMNADEVANYKDLKKPYYSVAIRSSSIPSVEVVSKGNKKEKPPTGPAHSYVVYALRSERSINLLSGAVGYFVHSLEDFVIEDGHTSRSLTLLDSLSDLDGWSEPQYVRSYKNHFTPVVLCHQGGNLTSLLFEGCRGSSGPSGKRPLIYDTEMKQLGDVANSTIRSEATSFKNNRTEVPPREMVDFELTPCAEIQYDPRSGRTFKVKLEARTVIHFLGDLFPSVSELVDAWGETGILLQFQQLTDADGVAVVFELIDQKTLAELEQLSGYTIRSATP